MIRVSKFFFPYFIFLLFVGFKGQVIMAFLIVIFHEFTHYITALLLGFSGFDMEILPIGARLSLRELDEATPKQDILISLSAPIMNLTAAAVFYFLFKSYAKEIFYPLYMGNLTIGLFNLIPAFPLDGGRVFRAIMCQRTIYKRANELMQEVFSYCEGQWRGIGNIEASGFSLRENYKNYDAVERFGIKVEKKTLGTCICSEILLGKKLPNKCEYFGKICTPEQPIGPCMVSAEGACSIFYKYKGSRINERSN